MRIAFVASRCILDRRSGAAIDLKIMLEQLAAAGHECHSITMTRFDGIRAFPLEQLIGPEHASERYRHCFLEAWHRNVGHRLFVTGSTRLPDLTREEAEEFARGTGGLLRRLRPDLVLTTGSDPVSETLHHLAREAGAVVVFYLANPSFTRTRDFRRVHECWSPTAAMADYYRETLGLHPRVVPNVLAREQFLDNAPEALPRVRGNRNYITLINPSPEKGATLFFRLAELAAQQRPDLQFLAVEARVSAAEWRAMGVDPAARSNITWVRNRRDMRPVYRRTAVLLMPSLWFEAAGRAVVEAQLSGISVLATNRGGLPEQLNGGGFLFDPPEACVQDFFRMPTADDVQPWLDTLASLMDDPEAYARASARARQAAAHFHPDERVPELTRTLEATYAAHAGSAPD
jgi:glycosyltransferase involved in cell wall biosynthesis